MGWRLLLVLGIMFGGSPAFADSHDQWSHLRPDGYTECWVQEGIFDTDGGGHTSSARSIIHGCDPQGTGIWEWITSPLMYITAGYFPALLIAAFVLFTYVRTGSAILAGIVGALHLPTAITLFPETLISGGLVMFAVVLSVWIHYAFVRQGDRRA